MAFTVYRSTDTGAPSLSGTNGSLVALLKACLVDGYGAKAAAGWTEEYAGANKSAFRQGAGCGYYLRVQDDGPGAGGALEARVVGYRTMTSVDNGSNAFPLTTQMANGLFVRKSATADATTRQWFVFADSKTAHIMIFTGDTSGVCFAWSFGDFVPFYRSSDGHCMIAGRTLENSASGVYECLDKSFGSVPGGYYGTQGLYVAVPSAIGGSTPVLLAGNCAYTSPSAFAMKGVVRFPNPADGRVVIDRIKLVNDRVVTQVEEIGYARGLWHLCHAAANFSSNGVIEGIGENKLRSFTVVVTGGTGGIYCVETSDTLDI